MSNPSVYLLGETKINNSIVRIEDNLGEAIHVHIGALRLSMTVAEFMLMSEQFQLAAEELLKLEGLSLGMFDVNSFDWDWIHRYEEIEKIEFCNIKIGDLLTVTESKKFPDIQEIVKVSRGRQYEALCGNYEFLRHYKEKNKYKVTNEERLDSILKTIKNKGYPYDNKYILVNQYNQIYDGDHRAACLLLLRGEDAVIPVIKMWMKNDKTIEEQEASLKKESKIEFCWKRTKRIQ